jgi:hypothetical protein
MNPYGYVFIVGNLWFCVCVRCESCFLPLIFNHLVSMKAHTVYIQQFSSIIMVGKYF